MDHTIWLNPYAFLPPQPDDQAPQSAMLLFWYAQQPLQERDICLLGCEYPDANIRVEDEDDDPPAACTFIIGCN